MACLLWYPTCSGGTAETVDLTEGTVCPLLVLWVGSEPWWWLCVADTYVLTSGPCRSFALVVIAGHQSEGFLLTYVSLLKMPCTTRSQNSLGLSSGGAPATKTPSNMAHASLSNPERSPKPLGTWRHPASCPGGWRTSFGGGITSQPW